jgi:hypothetical protein
MVCTGFQLAHDMVHCNELPGSIKFGGFNEKVGERLTDSHKGIPLHNKRPMKLQECQTQDVHRISPILTLLKGKL